MKETDPTKLCFAKKQTQFTKDYLTGKEVFLYADKTQGLRDKYQRILAYVATSSQEIEESGEYQDNYFYNDYLVETGNADTYRANPPAILFPRFETKRTIAESKGLGMWGSTCQN
jgi:endonuclease YncB( thermonuclease family)